VGRVPNHVDRGYPMLVEVQQRLGGVGSMQCAMVSHRGLCSKAGSIKWVMAVVVGCGVKLGVGKVWLGAAGCWVTDRGWHSQKCNWDGPVQSQSKLLARRDDQDRGKVCCGRLCGGSS